uniref:hypothetical protein n=1 Tax=Myxobolus honghuensis TaxID=1085956 RepID=UPI00300375A1
MFFYLLKRRLLLLFKLIFIIFILFLPVLLFFFNFILYMSLVKVYSLFVISDLNLCQIRGKKDLKKVNYDLSIYSNHNLNLNNPICKEVGEGFLCEDFFYISKDLIQFLDKKIFDLKVNESCSTVFYGVNINIIKLSNTSSIIDFCNGFDSGWNTVMEGFKKSNDIIGLPARKLYNNYFLSFNPTYNLKSDIVGVSFFTGFRDRVRFLMDFNFENFFNSRFLITSNLENNPRKFELYNMFLDRFFEDFKIEEKSFFKFNSFISIYFSFFFKVNINEDNYDTFLNIYEGYVKDNKKFIKLFGNKSLKCFKYLPNMVDEALLEVSSFPKKDEVLKFNTTKPYIKGLLKVLILVSIIPVIIFWVHIEIKSLNIFKDLIDLRGKKLDPKTEECLKEVDYRHLFKVKDLVAPRICLNNINNPSNLGSIKYEDWVKPSIKLLKLIELECSLINCIVNNPIFSIQYMNKKCCKKNYNLFIKKLSKYLDNRLWGYYQLEFSFNDLFYYTIKKLYSLKSRKIFYTTSNKWMRVGGEGLLIKDTYSKISNSWMYKSGLKKVGLDKTLTLKSASRVRGGKNSWLKISPKLKQFISTLLLFNSTIKFSKYTVEYDSGSLVFKGHGCKGLGLYITGNALLKYKFDDGKVYKDVFFFSIRNKYPLGCEKESFNIRHNFLNLSKSSLGINFNNIFKDFIENLHLTPVKPSNLEILLNIFKAEEEGLGTVVKHRSLEEIMQIKFKDVNNILSKFNSKLCFKEFKFISTDFIGFLLNTALFSLKANPYEDFCDEAELKFYLINCLEKVLQLLLKSNTIEEILEEVVNNPMCLFFITEISLYLIFHNHDFELCYSDSKSKSCGSGLVKKNSSLLIECSLYKSNMFYLFLIKYKFIEYLNLYYIEHFKFCKKYSKAEYVFVENYFKKILFITTRDINLFNFYSSDFFKIKTNDRCKVLTLALEKGFISIDEKRVFSGNRSILLEVLTNETSGREKLLQAGKGVIEKFDISKYLGPLSRGKFSIENEDMEMEYEEDGWIWGDEEDKND